MSSFTYVGGVPNPPNNPAVDVPSMQTNTNSVEGILAIDHFGFNNPQGGYHQQVHLVNEAAPGTGTASGVLFSNNNFPVWQNAAGIVQLFSGVPVIVSATNGYTFLAGAVILQWGFLNGPVPRISTNVNFNTPFINNPGIVVITPQRSNNNVDTVYVVTTSKSNFTYYNTSSVGISGFYWIAVGS